MREWVREQLMRRRSRRAPNESESTGKIGQELPTDQPAPLRPSYPEPIGEATPDEAEVSEAEVLQQRDPATASREPAPADSGELFPEMAVPASAEGAAEPVATTGTEDLADKHEEVPQAVPATLQSPAPEPAKLVVETQPETGTPPVQPATVPVRSPRGYVVLTIGLPGSGKTTWYKRRGVQPLSSDMLRTILFDDITEQRYQGLVFSTLRSLLRARLIAKMPWNYVDATNLSPHERRQWIKMAKSFGYEVQAVFFDVPLSVCLERNSKRDRQVTDEVMHRLAERLRPPAFKEGFDKITVVRVKGATNPTAVAPPPSAEAEAGAQAGAESASDAAVDG